MKKQIHIFIFALFLSFNATAEENIPSVTKKVENYFNSLQTFKASFQQFTTGEDYAFGYFYLQKPRQFLWQYTEPHNQKIVSTGSRMFFHNPQNEQTTQLPLNSGFAAVLTKSPFKIEESFNILDVKSHEGLLRIQIEPKEAEGVSGSRFVLTFEESPMRFMGMSMKDEFGQGIDIIFDNNEENVPLQSSLFHFTPAVEEFSN